MRNMHDSTERPEQVFARRMRELRGQMSQSQLAVTLNLAHGIKLDATAITRIEKGSRTLRLDEAVAIAAVLDQTVDEMLRPVLPPKEQIQEAEAKIDPARWRAARAVAEYEVAQKRLERLRARLSDDSNFNDAFGLEDD
jgi:transcriptional regulator with XRE-family HTH domain